MSGITSERQQGYRRSLQLGPQRLEFAMRRNLPVRAAAKALYHVLATPLRSRTSRSSRS